jgi:oligopeptide transport system substrate-binding protein
VAGIVSCWFNTLKPPFNNRNLRIAFSYAIQREKILNKLMLPNILSSSRPLPGILKDSFPAFSEDDLPYAKELFQKALQEMKIKHLKLTIAYETKEEHARLALLLKTNWEEAFPVTIVLKPLPFKEFFERLPGHEFHMTLFCALSQYTDLINFLERFEYSNSPRNFSGWENNKYQALLKKYRQATDQEKRLKLVSQAESLLMDEMPVAPIYSYHYSYLQKSHVKNLAISPIGVVQFDQVSLDKRQELFEEESLPEERYSTR